MSNQLTEKGFVFIGSDHKPYLCCMYGGEPWFMWWHEYDKTWITLRRVNQTEIFFAHENAMAPEHQDMYHELHQEYLNLQS